MRLRLTIPFGAAETPASFASRLAAANGTNAREFCNDFGIQFRQVVAGDSQAIAKVAELGGVDPAALQAQAFVRDGRMVDHGGERLSRDALRNSSICVCPACLQADIRNHPKLDPEAAAYGRASWMIDAVKTCRIHNRALVEIGRHSRDNGYDFAFHVRESVPELPRLLAPSAKRRPSGLENYVLDRLEHTARSEVLDGLDLHAAIKFCEVLGAVALFGIRVGLKKLSDDKKHLALARGFEIADGGPASICKFLDGLMAAAGDRNRKDGPGATFGRLHQWLTEHKWDPAYAPVRAIVGRYVIESFPLGINTRLFGDLITRQTRHSVRTLSLETGRHPKKLRKLLRAAGIIGDDQMALSDHNVTFDAQAGAAAVGVTSPRLYLPAVRAYLNAPRVQADLLVKHGFIKPRDPVAGIYDQYAIDDLDAFLGELTMGAKPVARPSAAMADIPKAARQACCSAADIVRMILEKKLAWVGRQRGVQGYLSVQVKVDEVKAAVRGAEHGGLTHREVREALQANYRVVLGLIANGHLADFRARNPVNRCVQSLIAPAELGRFMKTYVSLHMLAKERKQHHLAVKRDLDAAGIRPAFDHKKVRARFYRRRDC